MTDRAITQALTGGFSGGYAHMSLDDAVADFPSEHYNTKPANVPYSFWHLLEHIRLTAQDMLDYTVGETYIEGQWPDDYWPPRDATADAAAWQQTIDAINAIDARFQEIASGSLDSLAAPARHAGDRHDHTVIRSVRIVLQHESYHLGEFGILRQVEGLWPEGHA